MSGCAYLRHKPGGKSMAGGSVLLEDPHGKGHISRHSAEGQTGIWISLPSLDLPSG